MEIGGGKEELGFRPAEIGGGKGRKGLKKTLGLPRIGLKWLGFQSSGKILAVHAPAGRIITVHVCVSRSGSQRFHTVPYGSHLYIFRKVFTDPLPVPDGYLFEEKLRTGTDPFYRRTGTVYMYNHYKWSVTGTEPAGSSDPRFGSPVLRFQ